MKVYLVADLNESNLQFHSERFKIFRTRDKAIEHAEKLGIEGMFGFNDKVGIATIEKCGDEDFIFLPLEIEEDKVEDDGIYRG